MRVFNTIESEYDYKKKNPIRSIVPHAPEIFETYFPKISEFFIWKIQISIKITWKSDLLKSEDAQLLEMIQQLLKLRDQSISKSFTINAMNKHIEIMKMKW